MGAEDDVEALRAGEYLEAAGAQITQQSQKSAKLLLLGFRFHLCFSQKNDNVNANVSFLPQKLLLQVQVKKKNQSMIYIIFKIR